VKHLTIASAAIAAISLCGCAKNSSEITASYVSPIPYEALACRQIADEAQRISSRAMITAGLQDQKASQDAALVAVGAVIFWPALFALNGDGPQAAELSRLRGEMDALEQASARKRCGIDFQRA